MPDQEKSNAEEYLIEYTNEYNENWLTHLVAGIIDRNDEADAELLRDTYSLLLASKGLKELDEEISINELPEITETHNYESLQIHSIEHVGGVNKLLTNSSIPFHEKLTVVYGKNGSGKSSFSRILKCLADSRTQEDIIENIYADNLDTDPEANITFSYGEEETITWNGEEGVHPFNFISIFDGKCIPLSLQQNMSFMFMPYGFELFGYVTNAIQEIRRIAQSDIGEKRYELLDLGRMFDATTTVGGLMHSLSHNTPEDIFGSIRNWDEQADAELTAEIKHLGDLGNLNEKISDLETSARKLRVIKNALNSANTEFSEQNIKIYQEITKKYKTLKKELSEKKESSLDEFSIPERESDEWDRFISSADDYIDVIHEHEYPAEGDKCIYCLNELPESSLKLLSLYRKLFETDESESIEDVEETINEYAEELSASNHEEIGYVFDDFKKTLKQSDFNLVIEKLKLADNNNKVIADSLKSKKDFSVTQLEIGGLVKTIEEVEEKVAGEIKTLEDTQKNIDRQREIHQKKIDNLNAEKQYNSSKDDILAHYKTLKWTAAVDELITQKCKTDPITRLSTEAGKALITDTFKERFEQESNKLNAPEVTLQIRGETGEQKRNKSIGGRTEVSDILSEGEQRAVALSDFFAEISVQEMPFPVVIDDPSTSFDVDRKRQIAERIVEESEQRQVIVFTHDLMFASYLHGLCESRNNLDRNKASFHQISSIGGIPGHVNVDYYPASVKYEGQMQLINEKLEILKQQDNPQTLNHELQVLYSMLREAIEKVVEYKIFGGVINRWEDRTQLLNVERATLNKDKLTQAGEMHGEFSAYMTGHNQSNEQIAHNTPTIENFENDVKRVEQLAVRE